MHVANLDLIPAWYMVPPALPGVIPKYRARSNLRAPLGVIQNTKQKQKLWEAKVKACDNLYVALPYIQPFCKLCTSHVC